MENTNLNIITKDYGICINNSDYFHFVKTAWQTTG